MSNIIKLHVGTVGAVHSLEGAVQLALDALANLEDIAGQLECTDLVTPAYRARWEIETVKRMLGD